MNDDLPMTGGEPFDTVRDPSEPLENERYELFAREYVACGFRKTEAARRAGYGDNAHNAGWKLMLQPDVAERCRWLAERRLSEADVTAQRVLQELARIAFSDIRSIFDENGNLKQMNQIGDDAAAAISGLEVEIKPEFDEKGRVIGETRVAKIKRTDKMAALKVLAEHVGVVGTKNEKSEDQMMMAWAERLDQQRRLQREKRLSLVVPKQA
jgi:phage terminase small subunit